MSEEVKKYKYPKLSAELDKIALREYELLKRNDYKVNKTPSQALEMTINRLASISHLKLSDEALRSILKLKRELEEVVR